MSTYYNPYIDRNGLLVYYDAGNLKCWGGGTSCRNLVSANTGTGTVAASVLLDTDSIAGNCFSHSISGTPAIVSTAITCGGDMTIIWSSYPILIADKIPISVNTDAVASGPNVFYNGNVTAWNTGDGPTNSFGVGYPPLSVWAVHAVSNVSGAAAVLYTNGNKMGQASGKNMTTTNASVVMGNFHGGGYQAYMKSQIFAVYTRALNAQEIFQFFQAIRGRYNL